MIDYWSCNCSWGYWPTVADMHVDYDVALLIVQSSKARQYGGLVPGRSYLLRTLNNHVSHHIASGRCV